MGKGARPISSLSVLPSDSASFSERVKGLLGKGDSEAAQQLLAESDHSPDSLMELLIDIGERAPDPAVSSRCRHLIAWLASEQEGEAWGWVASHALHADLADPDTSPGFRDLAARKLEALGH